MRPWSAAADMALDTAAAEDVSTLTAVANLYGVFRKALGKEWVDVVLGWVGVEGVTYGALLVEWGGVGKGVDG